MSRLPSLFQSVVLAALASGCVGGTTIDRAKFTDNVCEGSLVKPLSGIKPAIAIDGAELRDAFSTPPQILDTFGAMCGTAKDKVACQQAVEALHRDDLGWFISRGDVGGRHYLATTSGEEVRAFTTIAELKSLLGVIDTADEAALLLNESTAHRIECGGNNVRSLPDGSFEVLTRTGSGCGKNDDVELHVVRVGRDGSISVTETETLKKSNPNCVIGRRPEGFEEPCAEGRDLGEFFARMAHLEAAAVPAFERLARELRAHKAPRKLIAAARRSARDEVRHAHAVARLARRFGGTPEPVRFEELAIRDLEAIALENATEGCVRETFGALIATYQAHAARDPQISKVMRGIAQDETRHAQLSWEVAKWALRKLDGEARTRIDAAVAHAVATLRHDMSTPVCPEAIELAGFPTPERARALFDAIAPEVWAA